MSMWMGIPAAMTLVMRVDMQMAMRIWNPCV